MAKTLDSEIAVNEFEFQLSYYVHFWTNTFEKDMDPFILAAMR